MTEGTIVKWYVAEGESVNAGDILCDIQTDKAVVSMEVDEDCVLAKIFVTENDAGVEVGF
jgi:pyruvate/2-oxoglutarate dehydrogenase complex dihydrolipoamide acyltransferase (E2) component